jgi:hypothetical protein
MSHPPPDNLPDDPAALKAIVAAMHDQHDEAARRYDGHTLNQWAALNVFAADGLVPIDNNISEREMKRIVLNRKNSMFVGNERGGRTAAILSSLTGTCRRHEVDRHWPPSCPPTRCDGAASRIRAAPWQPSDARHPRRDPRGERACQEAFERDEPHERVCLHMRFHHKAEGSPDNEHRHVVACRCRDIRFEVDPHFHDWVSDSSIYANDGESH